MEQVVVARQQSVKLASVVAVLNANALPFANAPQLAVARNPIRNDPMTQGDPRIQPLVAQRERFLAFVRRRLRTEADAEDLLQQAMLRAVERIDSLQQQERLDAWFYRILRNTLADHHVQQAARSSRFELLSEDVEDASPEQLAGCACTLGFLERLRPEQREILQLVDLHDESLSEAAETLQITSNNAKVRLYRARRALREQLHTCCGSGSFHACLNCSCE